MQLSSQLSTHFYLLGNHEPSQASYLSRFRANCLQDSRTHEERSFPLSKTQENEY